jgi:acetylornithine deacetylase/succinyl-diaminopimelate desuccinylase-like protein
MKTAMFTALQNAQKKVHPDSITLPTMTTGATDSAFMRTKGVQSYGIGVAGTEEDGRTVHGNDERLNIKQLGLFVQYLWSAVNEVAAK